MSTRSLLPAMLCTLIGFSQSFGFIIDGDLADWGVTVADDNLSVFNLSGVTGLLGSHLEDQDDHAGHGEPLGPNLGGQDWDAEMMAVARQGDRLYLAIVTGQRPDNGFDWFGPGDIRIETSQGIYGIEVGGGEGGGPGSVVTTGDPGSTYTLKNSGETKNHAQAGHLQTAGSIWTNATWLLDPIAPKEPTQFKINYASTWACDADYVYTRDAETSQHAIIELSFDTGPFVGQIIDSVHWRPACGNDELDVNLNPPVPEPGTLWLLACGGIGLIGYRRR